MSAPTARELLDEAYASTDPPDQARLLAARVEAVIREAEECDKAGCGMDPELVLRLLNGEKP